ncbi:Endoglucanase [Hortaea werneckii]|nr:Endoglucanase [Hortaea werneckii]
MKVTFSAVIAAATTAAAQNSAYSQCGGQNWSGSTACVSGFTCQRQNEYYSQCLPGSNNAEATTQATTTTNAGSAETDTTSNGGSSSGSGSGVQYAGVNIAGFDFGCNIQGTCDTSGIVDPGSEGIAQIDHFVNDDGLNAFRLPVGWQYLVGNDLGGSLDSSNFANYDNLVQGCLDSGAALCVVDVHNYARYNGAVVGQGGPTNAQFSSLWSQIAAKYADESRIVFGVMNEPHDLNIETWAETVQAAVTAIREAGATSQRILLPGNDFTDAAQFVDNGSAAALSSVTNLDGSTTNLIYDVHRYLDSDNSGTHRNCVTNNVDVFQSLGEYLRNNNRQAFLTETGGGPNADSCLTKLCQELSTLNDYSDVYLGWIGWGAGQFSTSYTLSETPMGSPGSHTDQPLVKQCIAGQFNGN